METIVKIKYIKQSPKKIRFVLNEIRGKRVDSALDKLDNLNKKAAIFISKAIKSGLSNLSNLDAEKAINNDNFFIKEAFVGQGPVMKRFRPAAMGRATPILKRSSHLTIKLSNNHRK